jgi:acetolactate synthase-1/2/3 large subunit
MHEANPERQMKFVVPANEQAAGFMAAGYARASGKVGVFMVTSGPGATNAVTPIADCNGDSVPVVLICGQVPRAAIGTDAFQEAPVFNIMSACAKQVFLVTDPGKLEQTLRTAFEIARTGRPGPVVVDVPKDIQNWMGPYQGQGTLQFRGYSDRLRSMAKGAHLDEAKRAEFFDLLAQSKRPLLYVGGGVIASGAAAQLRRFCERYRIPVVTSLMGLGALPATHELSLGMLGMHGAACANYAVEDCDFLIAVGARFDDRVAAGRARYRYRWGRQYPDERRRTGDGEHVWSPRQSPRAKQSRRRNDPAVAASLLRRASLRERQVAASQEFCAGSEGRWF